MTECEDVCKDVSNLTIYFFDEKNKKTFENIKLESGLDLPDRISYQHVDSFEEMLFWKDRGGKKKSQNEEDQEQQPKDCMLCSRPIKGEEFVTCHECLREVHGICNDVHADEGDGLCPFCDAQLDCEISLADERVELSSDEDDNISETMQIVENLNDLSFDHDDQQSVDSFDELLAPPTSKAERQSVNSLDELRTSRPKAEIICLSASDDSSMEMSPAKLPPKASLSEIMCLSADDDSSMEMSPVKLPRKAVPYDNVIDLCSP